MFSNTSASEANYHEEPLKYPHTSNEKYDPTEHNHEQSYPWDISLKKKSSESGASDTVSPAKKTPPQFPWEEKANKASYLGDAGISIRAVPIIDPQHHNAVERRPNWPTCYPLIYYDIDNDLPPGGKSYVRRSYFLWQLSFAIYLLNLVATISLMASGNPKYGSVGGLILSVVYLIVCPVLGFLLWHKLLYNAVKYDTAWRYLLWFFTFGVQLGFFLFLGIGVWAGGGGGLLGSIDMFKTGYLLAALFSLGCTICIIIYILLGCIHFKGVAIYYRYGGHSLQSAGTELGHSTARNSYVRNTVKSSVLNSV